jgi:hypothetical protein
LATTVGYNRIAVNSENIEVIETMKNGARFFDLSAAVFDDIYHIACDFSHIIFEHASRETNCAAHDLAKLVRSKVCAEWMKDPPLKIVDILVKDNMVITLQ